MNQITFETRTSTYELKRDEGGFTLTKLSHHAESSVGDGRAFHSKTLPYLTFTGSLIFEDMNTSPIKNQEPLRAWLTAQEGL